jgi:hypothetical protein
MLIERREGNPQSSIPPAPGSPGRRPPPAPG